MSFCGIVAAVTVAPSPPPLGNLLDHSPLLKLLEIDTMPGPQLDRYLDSLSRCIARYGLGRVSVQDVARDLGVDRTTVYRQVGPINHQIRLLAARELGRAFALLPTGMDGPVGVEDVVTAMTGIVGMARTHPVMLRIHDDDSDKVTLGDIHRVTATLSAAATAVAPLLDIAMSAGWLARRDPTVVANWLVSTLVWLVLMPPEADVATVLREIVGAVLAPPGAC